MIDTGRTVAFDAEHRLDVLARLIRSAARFSHALSIWIGRDLTRRPRSPDAEHAVSAREARLLDVPVSTRVTRRDGFLLAGPDVCVARITALVDIAHLDVDAQQPAAMHEGTPLGLTLTGVTRSTHLVQPSTGSARRSTALEIQAVLVCTGRPVVLVEESVTRQAISSPSHERVSALQRLVDAHTLATARPLPRPPYAPQTTLAVPLNRTMGEQ